jgi:hypothetical protein
MKYPLSPILATLSIWAFAGPLPAVAGNSGDANGMREQAQIHPNEVNQIPEYASNFVAQGEVYPSWAVSNGHFVRSPGAYTAFVPLAPNCYVYKTSYNGSPLTACGAQ